MSTKIAKPSDFACLYCCDNFKSKVDLSDHVWRKHSQDQVSQTDQPKTENNVFSKYTFFIVRKKLALVKVYMSITMNVLKLAWSMKMRLKMLNMMN